ncbi:MAG: hypothetical protein AB2687_17155, partial [Candidatus Thiodiazotropha taylori]
MSKSGGKTFSILDKGFIGFPLVCLGLTLIAKTVELNLNPPVSVKSLMGDTRLMAINAAEVPDLVERMPAFPQGVTKVL